MSNFIQKAIYNLSDFSDLESLPLVKGIMNSMNDGALIVDLSDKIIYANDKMCEITGYNRFDLIGKTASKLLLDEDFIPEMETKIKERKQLLSNSYELVINKKNGDKAWVRISGSPIFDLDNNVVGSIGLHEDISQRKKNEAALNKALKEKELLLQETHHRVKNNLQIISSLMSLQVAKIETAEDAKNAFITCQKRIKAIAVLHEIIYKCDDSGEINFNTYCEKIIAELQKALGLKEQNITISQTSDIGKMGMENALTCGMLINELVLNSVEHAFTKKGGDIKISASLKSNQTTIEISDNGKGLPEGFSLTQSHSLGLLLIGAFVEQLSGKIEVENNNGASFIISFPQRN